MLDKGFIKLHRRLTEWEWYDDANTFRLFMHLLLTANHKKSRYRGFDINPGSVVTGRNKLASQLNLSEQQIRTAINKLKLTSEITSKTTNDFSIISIVKWNDYQDSNQRATNEQPTSNHI